MESLSARIVLGLGRRPARLALLVAVACGLAACGGGHGVAPVSAPGRVTTPTAAASGRVVIAGDTLYAIAWESGLDYRDLAAWNAIPEPFTIYPGQRLRLAPPASDEARVRRSVSRPPSGSAPTPRTAAPKRKPPETARATEPVSPAATPAETTRSAAPATTPAPEAPDTEPVRRWQWPTTGRVLGTFARSGGTGVDIAGARGQPIVAAATGRVVYAGGGLRGYGELIIIKHNKRFLSAYAHNDRVIVKEGDVVTVGQRIAEMGSSGTNRIKLHFEIRQDGKPVDPVRYLPRRSS